MSPTVIQETQNDIEIPYLPVFFIDCYNIAPLKHLMSFTRSLIVNINHINKNY